MTLRCSLHPVDERHFRDDLVPALTGDDDARERLERWIGRVAPNNPSPPSVVVDVLRQQWQTALSQGVDADDFLAGGVVWNYGLLAGHEHPVFYAADFSFSFLEDAGLAALAHERVAPHGGLFADPQGEPLEGVPEWVPTETHGSFVGAEMAGGLVRAAAVPSMLSALRADLAGHAERVRRSGRDPHHCLEPLLAALAYAARNDLALLELAEAVTATPLVPPGNVRRAGGTDHRDEIEGVLGAPPADPNRMPGAKESNALEAAVRDVLGWDPASDGPELGSTAETAAEAASSGAGPLVVVSGDADEVEAATGETIKTEPMLVALGEEDLPPELASQSSAPAGVPDSGVVVDVSDVIAEPATEVGEAVAAQSAEPGVLPAPPELTPPPPEPAASAPSGPTPTKQMPVLNPGPTMSGSASVTGTRIIQFKPADLIDLFGLPQLLPGDTKAPDRFEIKARVVPSVGTAEARFTADGHRIASFKGMASPQPHSLESTEGFWAALSKQMAGLARQLEGDAWEAGVPVERVDIGIDAEATRDASGLHLTDLKVHFKAHAWRWVVERRLPRLKPLVGRAVFLWLRDAPARGKIRIRRPRLEVLPPRLANLDVLSRPVNPPLGRYTRAFVERGTEAVSELIDHLNGTDPYWRVEALLALLTIQDRRALRAVVSAAGDRTTVDAPFTLKIGRRHLVSAGPPHDRYTLGDIAAWGLGIWTYQARIGTTKPIRRDPHFWRRFLEEHSAEAPDDWRMFAIERAADVLCSGDEIERKFAAERLGERDLAGPEAGKALIVALSVEESRLVVEAAIRSVMVCRARSAIPYLVELLDDPRLPDGALLFEGRRPEGIRDMAARAIHSVLRRSLAPLEGRPDPIDEDRLTYDDGALHERIAAVRQMVRDALAPRS